MEYLDIENRNEFIRKTNNIISKINEYLNFIKKFKPEIKSVDNVGQLYFDKILQIEKIFKEKNLKYFELQDNILNRMIDFCLYNYVEYAFYVLEKIIITTNKFYGLPILNKIYNVCFNQYLNEYEYICGMITDFSIEKNLIDAFFMYAEYSSKVENKVFSEQDAEQLNCQLSNLGINNLIFTVKIMPMADKSKVKVNVIK